MKTRKRGTVILQYNGYIDRVVGVCNPLQVARRYWRTQSSRVLAVGVGMKWSSITNNLLSSSSSLCLSLPLSLSTGILLSANISSFSEFSLYWYPFLSRYTWFPERTSPRKRYGKDCQNVSSIHSKTFPNVTRDPH